MSFFSGTVIPKQSPDSAQDTSLPMQGEWLTLVDYSHRTGVSLSTLRRYIKADKVPYRLEQGKYLLQFTGNAPALQSSGLTAPTTLIHSLVVPSGLTHQDSHLRQRVQELEIALRRAKEEIAELKMLVALYEQTSAPGEGESWSGGQA